MLGLILFWASVALIGYTYVLFPIWLWLRAAVAPRPHLTADVTPTVSLIIVAHNEAAHIAAKLRSVLALDYPPERLEIVVASDGSDDATESLVRDFAPAGVQLLALPRQGKIAALNAAVAASGGEILIFSDADALFAADALRALVRPFVDPQVGGVVGDYAVPSARENQGQRSYQAWERRLKSWQSLGGSVTSASGALYAVQRTLFFPVPPGVTDDFAISTRVVEQHRRLVFAPAAVAYESAAAPDRREFRRKLRIITRGLRGLWLRRRLFDPRVYGFYAIQLASHKLLRRLVALPLLGLFIASWAAWPRGVVYQGAACAQLTFYLLALVGAIAQGTWLGRSKLLAIPYYFCLVNAAGVWACVLFLAGRRIDCWDSPQTAVTAWPTGEAFSALPPRQGAS